MPPGRAWTRILDEATISVLTRSRTFNKLAEAIFHTVIDVASSPVWNPTVRSACMLSDEPIGEGAQFEMTIKGYGKSSIFGVIPRNMNGAPGGIRTPDTQFGSSVQGVRMGPPRFAFPVYTPTLCRGQPPMPSVVRGLLQQFCSGSCSVG